MKLIKYFLQRRSVTILLLVLVLAGGLFSYVKMGKLEDAPFTIKQALVLTSYPGASPSEVIGRTLLPENREPCRAFQNHRICKERDTGR